MRGEEFTGYSPQSIRWDFMSENIYFSWNPEMEIVRSTYRWSPLIKQAPEKVSAKEESYLPSSVEFNSDRNLATYTLAGDLFISDLISGERKRVIQTAERINNPFFSEDENYIHFQMGDNLHRWHIEAGTIEQLIEFKSGSKSTTNQLSPQNEWLERDQLELFETLSIRKQRREKMEERREVYRLSNIPTVYTGSKTVSSQRICPNGRFITYMLSNNPGSHFTNVPNYVTESGQVENIRSRPKVGHPQTTYEFWIYDLEGDTSFQLSTENIPGIKRKPEFLREYHSGEEPFHEEYEKAREVVIHGPHYSENGKAVVVVRSLDNKDRWIMKLNLSNGDLSMLDHQRDEAWIGGPGISGWNFSSGNVGWMKDNLHFYFQSEQSGFSHLYKVNTQSGLKSALTKGEWEVEVLGLSHDGKTFFISSNKESPFQTHFYHLPAEGGEMEKITTLKGGHEVVISPDEKHLAIRYSPSNRPWELYWMENQAGAELNRITHSTTEDFEKYEWLQPEIIWFEAEDGVMVPARIYEPENDNANGAAIIFVHGAGYLQNVHHWWSSYFREYMFHHILRDNGYTVLDIDFRASAGYGRDWRTAIYRHMGGKDLSDQVDGAHWLVNNRNIEPEKIGIYGGSYGGFITIMALFLESETFTAGAALRSVTDWAHYNHGYTSNILNTPVEDSLAFRRSSPIYHAEGLEGALLMLHGVIDVNVQYQDVVRLAQRLIELEKDNWDLAIYPLEDHGFIEASAWTDEYRRIFYWFQRHLLGKN
ncbi:MAG: S9 family peptidase [Saprospirales bacterium]|nr:MAG: S9 family peptidase [Saprospirales bacterium]